jgi:hypothetical protein
MNFFHRRRGTDGVLWPICISTWKTSSDFPIRLSDGASSSADFRDLRYITSKNGDLYSSHSRPARRFAVVDEETGVQYLEHEEGVARRYLVDPINFIEGDRLGKEDQKWVFEMWLRCLLLDLEEKPLLFLR